MVDINITSEIKVLALILSLYGCINKIFKFKSFEILSEPLYALKVHLLVMYVYILFIKESKR